MGKTLKNIEFFLVTILLTAIIFWLVFVDNESKQDVLEHSLGLLGKKLMAMMPDTSDTRSVATLYDDFVARAKNKEMPPEKIEHMAAAILNLSQIDTAISPREAEAMIRLSLADPVKIEKAHPESIKISRADRTTEYITVAPPPKPERKISPEEWQVLGERIKSAYQFNTEYQKAMREFYDQRHAPEFHMQFKVEDGLRIAMDSTLKRQFDARKYRHLQKQMQELEKQRIIIWRKNFHEEMRKEMEQRRQQLESLKQLQELEKLKNLQGLEALNSLESLKSLEALQHLPVVNADSIRIIVERSLKEAGIDVDKEKK